MRATGANDAAGEQTFTLTVEGPPPLEPEPRLRITLDGGNRPTLEWGSIPGAWYQVEVSEDLVHWSALGAAGAAEGESTCWQDAPLGSPPPRRFYRVRGFGVFTVNVTGNSFTYTDAQRSVTGILRKPAGGGPFPAVVINHGTGGSAGGYAGARATEMLPWGLVCIGADLTHQDTGAPEAEMGHSPENHARIEACLAVPASRGYVDMNRVAMFGSSRGSFTAVGSASLLGARVRALGICAGGVLEDGDASEASYPSMSESSGITAPALIFHGSNDTVVPPASSLRLQTLLSSLGVPNNRILHATTGAAACDPAAPHGGGMRIMSSLRAAFHALLLRRLSRGVLIMVPPHDPCQRAEGDETGQCPAQGAHDLPPAKHSGHLRGALGGFRGGLHGGGGAARRGGRGSGPGGGAARAEQGLAHFGGGLVAARGIVHEAFGKHAGETRRQAFARLAARGLGREAGEQFMNDDAE